MSNPNITKVQISGQITVAQEANKLRAIPTGYIIFALAHIPLALLMEQTWAISGIHALLTFAIGMWWAATDHTLQRVALVASYISGAEVLWRMTEAYQIVFWEFGKYALIAILVIAMLRTRTAKLPLLPFLYFAFLLPSVSQSISRLGFAAAREQVSFNLSGPACLLVSAWFFANTRLTLPQLKRLLFILVVPALGVGSIVASVLLSTRTINWYLESNTIVTGGFGPNQVSAILGLGWLIIWLALLFFEHNLFQRIILMVTSSLLLAASLFSFSRGGVLNAIVPSIIALGFSLSKPGFRQIALIQLAIALALAILVVIPQIDAITGGAFTSRFIDTSSAGRDKIVQSNLLTFIQNPIWGVGPGASGSASTILPDRETEDLAAHTEYTRSLAEHGLLGAASVLLLALMCWRNFRRGQTMVERGLIVSMIAWSLIFMAHSAMRIAVVSFLIGLSFAISSIFAAPDSAPDTLANTLQDA